MQNHAEQIGKLWLWCHKNKLKLLTNEDSEFCSESMHITVNSRISEKHTIYDILHEAGHFLVYKHSKNDKKYKNYLRATSDHRFAKSMRTRIEILREEFDAWERGWKLGERLGLVLDFDAYQNYASKQIATYCDWISERDWNDCMIVVEE